MISQEPVVRRYGEAAIAEAAALVLAGKPVGIATETVYGLAADATNGVAVASIYAAKGRPSFNPLIVHVPDAETAARIARFDDRARLLAARFWPGPLTMVLPLLAEAGISTLATAGLPTVALRMPAHPAIRALLSAAGRPLAAPSANASGGISATTAGHVAHSLAGRIPLVIDSGATPVGLESTIVALDAHGWRLLRPGPITRDALAALLGPASQNENAGIEAPGQLASHYAPAKPLRLNAVTADTDEWLIGFGTVSGHATLSAAGNLQEAAATLFGCLHEADASGLGSIAVAPVPDLGLGEAINDRLRRAAAPR
ncbi:L-threonylcarbamoyladenylate synthase [Sphingomonas jejuensis]|uniref:Threonylcarbamoyl-AMP synthase n=1 Tax=Sphingomonas jejuensis TaxID=904715 RepID=A0ABX0XN34_9SPHN|nr:L-threonylcarbamoyladenylate synthase [Sphingomonas jejuensis]NJC34101.1 L-threonylcarbamoyladenylate synthase [Sphingomonas jejuensis]